MSKKDYELIASVLYGLYHFVQLKGGERWVILSAIHSLADKFEDANPKFNRSKFLQSCGLEA